MPSSEPTKPTLLHSAAGPLLWALLFAVIYVILFYAQKTSPFVINNETIKRVFNTYSVAVGPAYALLCMIGLYILAGFKRMVGLRNIRILNPILLLIVMVSSAVFGWNLMHEKPFIDISRGILGFVAFPLFWTSVVMSALGLIWFVSTLVRRG